MAVATFVSFRGISTSIPAQRILYFGIAALTAASLYVIARQVSEPGYSPVFPGNKGLPSGFYAHYSYGGSYLIAVSSILLGLALYGKERIAIRLLLGLVALLALVGVYYTRSRGAIFGAMGGLGILLIFTLLLGKRDKKKWFTPAILAAPFLAAAFGYALYVGWSNTQEVRGNQDVTDMLDNAIRFYLASIALSCFQLHPLIGGGARSYSWESYRFWDYAAMGQGKFKPEHVHNELLQTATDYGIIGAGLLVVFLVCVTILVIYRASSRKTSDAPKFADGWRIGGIAGLAALFIQSNFEGIFRVAPGAIILAICLSAACFPVTSASATSRSHFAWFRSGLVSSVGIISAILLLAFGLKGTRVSLILWPSFFGKTPVGNETKLDALNKAIPVWPLMTLYRERAEVAQKLAAEEKHTDTAADFMKLSLADFKKIQQLHPYDPAAFVNSANLLSSLGRYQEAESHFAKAIKLQGEMEACFQSHFHAALHYQRKALKEYDPENSIGSLSDMQIATGHIEKAFTISWIHGNERDMQLRVTIHQNYGRLLETLGEPKKALEVYDFIAQKPYGRNSHYLAALLYGRLAVDFWFDKRRPEDALYFFNSATHRMWLAKGDLPKGVTPEQREEHSNYFKNSINTLKGGKIVPSKSVKF
ncbi:MAG: O-antigen ligase family protein [Akkermansiaceae bacterium]|nr:O-antigen ligase family protein [Akkermansiaceae bacterium]MDP4645707.1 O-antigen ligase family protein [Akkermansiaceae bacterium]